jgi:hypothetical protein
MTALLDDHRANTKDLVLAAAPVNRRKENATADDANGALKVLHSFALGHGLWFISTSRLDAFDELPRSEEVPEPGTSHAYHLERCEYEMCIVLTSIFDIRVAETNEERATADCGE